MKSLENQLVTALTNANPNVDSAHDIAHVHRVWNNARAISQGENAGDQRILMAASYLHDLINLPKNHPNRAAASVKSAKAAHPILTTIKFTPKDIDATQHAIAAHSFSANIHPETIEAKILQDADRIDALGAIGIARTFAVSGALGRPLFDPTDPFAIHRPLDDHRYAIDHWPLKLLRLPAQMKTNTGKTIAITRSKIMYDYLDTLSKELDMKITPDSPFFLS